MTYKEAVDRYMHGHCMFLAAALHHEWGLWLGMMRYTAMERVGLYHAWAVLPDSRCLDIQGIQPIRMVCQDASYVPEVMSMKIVSRTKLQDIEKLCGTPLGRYENKVVAALNDFKQFFTFDGKSLTFHDDGSLG